jgi:long-chain acyl-CoA synthetase
MEVRKSIAAAEIVPDAMDAAAREFKGRTAMRYRPREGQPYNGRITYDEMVKNSRIAATSLITQFNLQPEQCVGVVSENRPEYNIGDVAVLFAAGTPWGLYDYDVRNRDIVEYKLKDSETSLMMVSPMFLDAMRAVVNSGRTPLKKLIVLCREHDNVKFESFETPFWDLIEKGSEDHELVETRVALLDSESTYKLIYTSGTTGMPKGVMLSHGNILSNVKDATKVMNPRTGRKISYLPEAHSFQGMLTYLALLNGVEIWYSFKKTIIEDVKDIRPTLFPGVPVVYKKFADGMRERVLELTKGYIDIAADYKNAPLRAFVRKKVIGPLVAKKAGLDAVEIMVSGSAKLDQEHASALNNIGLRVYEGYGISETAPVISVEAPDACKPGSVGRPIPNVQAKIIALDEDDNGVRQEQPRGDVGEVWIKGPNVFKGYYKDPEKTAKAKPEPDAYFTGDLGHMDEDGFLFIHGRAGLQVKMLNGEFVDLDHLAANILRHTTLVQAAVVDAEMQSHAVAIVSIAWEPEAQEPMAEQLGIPFDGDSIAFAKNEKVIAAVKKELLDNKDKFGNPRAPSTPKKFLYVRPMSPETGEITSTMKLRVKNVLGMYKEKLQELRKSDEEFMVYVT